jgi:hypothetical protein
MHGKGHVRLDALDDTDIRYSFTISIGDGHLDVWPLQEGSKI